MRKTRRTAARFLILPAKKWMRSVRRGRLRGLRQGMGEIDGEGGTVLFV